MSNESQAFFSIIIPCYNRAKLIGRTITSVLSQNYPNFELIIVDDGSTDKTSDVVKTYKDNRIRFISKENRERGAARNTGIQLAGGEYITFLDSDDIFYQNHLELAKEYIESKNPKIFFQQYEIIDDNGKRTLPYIPNNPTLNLELVKKGNFMSCHGVFLHKDVASDNKFNETRDLAGSEDYEFWLRLAAKYPIEYSSKVTNALIQHNERSVVTIEPNKLVRRKEVMLNLLNENEDFMKSFGNYWSLVRSNAYMYLALHLALSDHRRLATNYLFKSLLTNPTTVFQKAFWLRAYHLILA